jgi:hypothetical protein
LAAFDNDLRDWEDETCPGGLSAYGIQPPYWLILSMSETEAILKFKILHSTLAF